MGNDNKEGAGQQQQDGGWSLEELKQQKGSTKGCMRRIKNLVESNTGLSHTELDCRLGIVESYYKQIGFFPKIQVGQISTRCT